MILEVTSNFDDSMILCSSSMTGQRCRVVKDHRIQDSCRKTICRNLSPLTLLFREHLLNYLAGCVHVL